MKKDLFEQYSERFSDLEKMLLAVNMVNPRIARRYGKRFNANDIIPLHYNQITPTLANQYHDNFDGLSIICLNRVGYSISGANRLHNLSREEVIERCKKRDDYRLFMQPQTINSKKKGYSNKMMLDKGDFARLRINPSQTRCYAKRIRKFLEKKCIQADFPIGSLKEYDSRFNYLDLYNLIVGKVPPKEANKFGNAFSGAAITFFYTFIGVKRDDFGCEDWKLASMYNFKVYNSLFSSISKKDGTYLIGNGCEGYILFRYAVAWKYNSKAENEFEVISKIQKAHKGRQKNIIRLTGEEDNGLFGIEYISGGTLQDLVNNKEDLSNERVFNISSQIMNGLIEMRRAGVWYHRDIRPANIMIDEGNDRAVIIDLGMATIDRHALAQYNRRYGAVSGSQANDLVSLGQIMYKMITGEHIFARSKSMETSLYAEKLRDYRDKVYSDPTGRLLQRHLDQVDRNVQDENVRDLIKACLTAKYHDYRRMQRMFERYVK